VTLDLLGMILQHSMCGKYLSYLSLFIYLHFTNFFDYLQFLFYILCFLVQNVILTKNDMKWIIWLLNPEVQCVIAIRSVFASFFLLPGMKMVNSTGIFKSYIYCIELVYVF